MLYLEYGPSHALAAPYLLYHLGANDALIGKRTLNRTLTPL